MYMKTNTFLSIFIDQDINMLDVLYIRLVGIRNANQQLDVSNRNISFPAGQLIFSISKIIIIVFNT